MVIEKPGSQSDAEMAKVVKQAMLQGDAVYDITTRKSKTNNVILEIKDKAKADKLSEVLRARLGEAAKVRRPSQGIALLIIGIEDSVETEELRTTLKGFDERLESTKAISIREGRVRTAVVRVPIKPGIRLLRARKIKLGWSICRVKELAKSYQRCVRYKSEGHIAKNCTEP